MRHIVEFDPDTGEMVRDYGGQGYEEGSSWTRGQTWGLIELAKLHEGRQQKLYLDAALKLLRALADHRLNWDENEDNLLTKCTGAYHDKEHEFSIIYGDYYFLEALMKLTGQELFIW